LLVPVSGGQGEAAPRQQATAVEEVQVPDAMLLGFSVPPMSMQPSQTWRQLLYALPVADEQSEQ
jgi:hypothetical protein